MSVKIVVEASHWDPVKVATTSLKSLSLLEFVSLLFTVTVSMDSVRAALRTNDIEDYNTGCQGLMVS